MKMDQCVLYFNQLKAMLIRNVTLKFREKRKLLWEILLPLYSFLVLALMKMAIPNPNYPASEEPPYRAMIFDNYSLHLNYTVAVVPNSTEVLEFVEHARNKWNQIRNGEGNAMNFIVFNSKEELHEQYWYEPTSLSMAVIFNTSEPITNPIFEYEIRTNPSFTSAPTTGNMYADLSACRDTSYAFAKALDKSKISEEDDCPAYGYYTSGFVTLQILFDFTKIAIMTGIELDMTQIDLRLFPKEAYVAADWMLLFRLVIPAYLVMSLSQFVTYLLMLIVKEKETKIKETLRIAGLPNSIFWLSWFIVYAAFVLIMALAASLSMFCLDVFRHSNFLLIFTLIMLYGFSIILFSFMLVPFLQHYRTAGIIGNFVVNTISLLYLIRLMMKKIDARYLWFLSLLSPTAFTLAMDKALTMDVNGDQLNWNNMFTGPGMSFGSSLIVLCIDNCLYILLAYYFDLVIPGQFGVKRSPLFFLKPFCCVFNFAFGRHTKPQLYSVSANANSDDIEPVPDSFKDKVGIEVIDLHKNFSFWCRRGTTSVLKGINLTMYEGQITAILGHNGAGKTTLFNILTGMTAPSSGTALIFGRDIRKPEELNAVRKMFGVCPQHNILFDNLTVREHLELYSAVRGIPRSKREEEITNMLQDINLKYEADMYSKHLSGGQKRKLCIACAIMGNPKILIFDEPTAGIDPYSRRTIWSLLQKYKDGKVILLTTHFMDEADLLADRKAVISKGQLRCVGTSLFLKNKFGVGYHLTFVLDANNLSRDVHRAVQRHIPEVELARHNGKELSLILPYSSVDKFATLFKELEFGINQGGNPFGISSYGISMTTLEEVFLYLEKGDELENQEGSIGNRVLKRRIEGVESSSLRRRRISTQSSISESFNLNVINVDSNGSRSEAVARGLGLDAVKMKPNSYDVVLAMVKLRFLNFFRESARSFSIVFIPVFFFVIGIHFVYKDNPDIVTKSLILNGSTYENSSFIVQDSSLQTDLVNYFDTHWEMENESQNVSQLRPNIGLIRINNCCHPLNITIMYNDTDIHSLPVIITIIDNALYRMLFNNSVENENATIITKSFPFLPKSRPGLFDFGLVSIALGLGVQFVAVSVILASDYVYDRELKAKNLLRVTGLPFWTYYLTFFIVLVAVMLFILGLHLVMIIIFDVAPFKQPAALAILAVLFMLYTPCAILFATTLSYFFHSAETAQSVLLNCTTFIGLIPFGLVLLLDLMLLRPIYMFILHAIFSIFNSFYLPFAIIYFVGRIYLGCLSNGACSYVTIKDYFTSEILIIATSCCLQIPVFLLLLQLLEYWKSGGPPHSAATKSNVNLATTNIDNENDSEDVKFEKFRVTNYLSSSSDSSDHPLVIIQDLKKQYGGYGRRNILEKTMNSREYGDSESRPKLAISGLTFAVGRGEVFGLLGHNGAGKTTTLKIITAEEYPNSGQVQVGGFNILDEDFKHSTQFIGYCPQDDVLWKNISVEEHIKLYAVVRGIPRDKIREITDSYIAGLQIQEHKHKFPHQCSGGTKRKLAFAIAMIGNPSIVLMDEPSNGMDPHSKRFLWDTILCSFQGGRSAIVTTQAMEEVEALCSRVGILVNGKLRCIGSTQHLKNLYGAGYTLEIKIESDAATTDKEQKVKNFVKDAFPAATVEETFSDHLVFCIPQSSVRSLATCFTKIENAKHLLNIEEYSFSQTTLEQVFMKLAHAEDNAT